ncbi:MAG: RNA 2',3'-cyclic phosphodiesterase [Actinomycetota bacterium]
MRLFVGIFPPSAVREALSRAARELPVRGQVRWVSPENIHLTLKFLGEVPEDTPERLAGPLAAVCAAHEPFEAELSGFGAFPSPVRARIIWAGLGEGADRLRALAADVEEALHTTGFERERRGFVPHLTLGRARGRPVMIQDAGLDADPPGFTVRRVELIESRLSPSGSVYATVAGYGLGG